MIARLAMIYERILKYLEFQLFADYDRLYTTNLLNPKIIAKQVLVYEEKFE